MTPQENEIRSKEVQDLCLVWKIEQIYPKCTESVFGDQKMSVMNLYK